MRARWLPSRRARARPWALGMEGLPHVPGEPVSRPWVPEPAPEPNQERPESRQLKDTKLAHGSAEGQRALQVTHAAGCGGLMPGNRLAHKAKPPNFVVNASGVFFHQAHHRLTSLS